MAPRATIQSSIDEARVSMGELKRGEHIDVLAKVKGWEWGGGRQERHRHRLCLSFDAVPRGQIRSVSTRGVRGDTPSRPGSFTRKFEIRTVSSWTVCNAPD